MSLINNENERKDFHHSYDMDLSQANDLFIIGHHDHYICHSEKIMYGIRTRPGLVSTLDSRIRFVTTNFFVCIYVDLCQNPIVRRSTTELEGFGQRT